MRSVYKTIDLPEVHFSEQNKEKIKNISISLLAVYYVPGDSSSQYDYSYLPKYYSIAVCNSFAPEVYVRAEEYSDGTKLLIEYRLHRMVQRLLLVLIGIAILLAAMTFLLNAQEMLFPQTPESRVLAFQDALFGLFIHGGSTLIMLLFSKIGLMIEAARFTGKYKRELYKCLLSHSGTTDALRKKYNH